jgi:hypothetical protein
MEKRPVGRPRKQLNETTIYQAAAMMHTDEEIAVLCDCSSDTLKRNYAELVKKGREQAKASLRAAQWEKAIVEKNVTMQIWLGKHYLDQRDEIKLSNSKEPEVKQLMYAIKKMGTPE